MKNKISQLTQIISIFIICLFFTFNLKGQTIKGHTLGKTDVEKEFQTTLGASKGTMKLEVMDNNILGIISFEAVNGEKNQVDLMVSGLSAHLGIKFIKEDPSLNEYDYLYSFENDKFNVSINGYYDDSMYVSIISAEYFNFMKHKLLEIDKKIEELSKDNF